MTQRVLVTAGGSGIGKAIARAFVESGATATGDHPPVVCISIDCRTKER